MATILLGFFLEIQKFFFLIGQAHTSPPPPILLVAGQLKKELFCGFPYWFITFLQYHKYFNLNCFSSKTIITSEILKQIVLKTNLLSHIIYLFGRVQGSYNLKKMQTWGISSRSTVKDYNDPDPQHCWSNVILFYVVKPVGQAPTIKPDTRNLDKKKYRLWRREGEWGGVNGSLDYNIRKNYDKKWFWQGLIWLI